MQGSIKTMCEDNAMICRSSVANECLLSRDPRDGKVGTTVSCLSRPDYEQQSSAAAKCGTTSVISWPHKENQLMSQNGCL